MTHFNVSLVCTRYAERFISTPYVAILGKFETIMDFWQEFDYLPQTTRKITKQDTLNFGLRLAIKMESADFPRRDIDQLAHDMRFPSSYLVYEHFDSMPEYLESVKRAYDHYVSLNADFVAVGVKTGV